MKILIVGDIMLGRLVNEVLKQAPPTYPWGNTLPIFKQADLRIGNLECVIADRGEPWSATPKVFHFRSDAKNVEVLKVADINAVSLANNHLLDFGYEAMLDCLNILRTANIQYAGAGLTFEEASRPAILQAAGVRTSFVAFTDNEPGWEATENKPGIFYVPTDLSDSRCENLFRSIKQAKANSDLVIVSAHWGSNWGDTPPREHEIFGRRLIDEGADIVYGHSAHVFRGIELYQQKVILYSTGDFVDDYAVDEIERNDESFIFILELEEKTVKRLVLYPTTIRKFAAYLARGDQAVRIAANMQALCGLLGTQANWNPKDGYLEIDVSSRPAGPRSP